MNKIDFPVHVWECPNGCLVSAEGGLCMECDAHLVKAEYVNKNAIAVARTEALNDAAQIIIDQPELPAHVTIDDYRFHIKDTISKIRDLASQPTMLPIVDYAALDYAARIRATVESNPALTGREILSIVPQPANVYSGTGHGSPAGITNYDPCPTCGHVIQSVICPRCHGANVSIPTLVLCMDCQTVFPLDGRDMAPSGWARVGMGKDVIGEIMDGAG